MKNKIEDTSKPKEELQFVPIDKPPCENCKNAKEHEVKFELFSKSEMDYAMTIVDKMRLTREQQEFLVNLNNRVNKDNKRLGCGKCFTAVIRNLKNAYQRLYGND